MKTLIPLGIALAGWLACGLSVTAASATATAADPLFQAARAGDRAKVQSLLKAGLDANSRDAAGNTPLIQAAFCADASVLELLLDAGAEVNASNQAGATALMRAAMFGDKARLLVAHHADVKARSGLGNTALIIAARQPGNVRTVKLLLDQGADVNATNVFGAAALMAAVAAEDAETTRLLLDRGADVNAKPTMVGDGLIWGGGRTALMWAAFRGNVELIRLLLERGAKANDFTLTGGALAQAAWAGELESARVLLEAGAQVDQRDLIANYTPLHWAASSERLDPRLVDLLLAQHADPNAEGGQPVDGFLGVAQTPLMLARKRGETPIVQALLKSGARDVAVRTGKQVSKPARRTTGAAVDAAAIAESLHLAVGPVQKTALESPATFRKHASKQECISCHQQQLPLIALSLARKRHIPVDEAGISQQAHSVERFFDVELDLQATFHPEPAIGDGYGLLALHLENRAPSEFTDSAVHQLAATQNREGYWPWNLPRPPIQSSAIGATALALQALQHYPIPGRQREFEQRVQRARAWLEKAQPESTEERTYQLLGLSWAGDRPGKLKSLAEGLIREQRPDGGWGQLAKLPSDAFATGQSLYALQLAAGISGSHPAVQKGLRFLLDTQLEDGTWHVRRRAFPFQPPMDSGFPHGADGWISAAGTSWAVMALASALDPAKVPPPQHQLAKAAANGSKSTPVTATRTTASIEFARDIQPLFERSCVACHSGERAKGGFQVVNRAALLQGGKRGEPAIVANHSAQSALLRFVTDQVEDLEMPPLGRREKFPALTKDEVARLSAWVDQGAIWPEDVKLRLPSP